MWKAGLTEGGSDALMASLSGEMMAGQPELAVAELALFGFILGAKKLSEHHKNKKAAKHSAEEEKQRQEDEYQAQEQARIRAEEEQKQRDAEAEAQRRQEEAKQQQQLIHDDEQVDIQEAVNVEYWEVAQLENEREQRLAIFSGQVDPNAPRVPYDHMNLTPGGDDPEAPDEWRLPNPNWPGGGGNGGGGGGGGGGGNGDDYVILDPAGQPAANQFQNPFWNMIGQATAQLSMQLINQKKQDGEIEKQIIDDLPKEPTEEQKIAIDAQKQAHADSDQIAQGQAEIQQQLIDVLTGLGEGELTQEEALAELDKIEADLNKIMGSQVKTTQIYSSSVRTF